MRKTFIAAFALALAPLGSAVADGLVRDILSSGATTASTYLTFKDNKLVIPAREDAGHLRCQQWRDPWSVSGSDAAATA